MSTHILKLCRNSTGVPYFVTEASSCRHCHCHCHCLPLATTTTTVAPWLHHRRLRRHCIVIGTAVTTVFPPLFCDLFDFYVIVSSPLYCRALLLLLHTTFHHHLPSRPPFVCRLLFQAADKAIAADDGVVVVVSAFRSCQLLSLSAPAHSHRFPWQSLSAVRCPHS